MELFRIILVSYITNTKEIQEKRKTLDNNKNNTIPDTVIIPYCWSRAVLHCSLCCMSIQKNTVVLGFCTCLRCTEIHKLLRNGLFLILCCEEGDHNHCFYSLGNYIIYQFNGQLPLTVLVLPWVLQMNCIFAPYKSTSIFRILTIWED